MTGSEPTAGTLEMLRLVARLPRQLEESADLPGLGDAGVLPAGCRRIILCGMGGSAIAGDLVAPLLAGSGVQLTVWRDYGLPSWAAPGDLVIASSYSGDTEETLTGAAAAGELGLARVVVSTGGKLGGLAGDEGLPMVTLPGGLPPRASLGYGLGTLVRLFGAWGLVPDAGKQIASAIRALDRTAAARMAAPGDGGGDPPADPAGHPAVAALAAVLVGRTPVLHTAGAEAHPAGVRWRAQLNENGKMPAALAAYPELDHNELEGWDLASGARRNFALVVLCSPGGNHRLERRVAATTELLIDQFDSVHTITAAGDTPLARIMDLVQYGDFLSCHLAVLRGTDALPVARIARLKQALAEGPGNT